MFLGRDCLLRALADIALAQRTVSTKYSSGVGFRFAESAKNSELLVQWVEIPKNIAIFTKLRFAYLFLLALLQRPSNTLLAGASASP